MNGQCPDGCSTRIGGRYDSYGGLLAVQSRASGFFRLECIHGVWWLMTPEGHGFLCRGVNHVDSAALKHPDNIHLFRSRYGDEKTWIQQGVVQPLLDWGFNAIAWNQEVLQWRSQPFAPHTPVWRHERYRWAGIPYIHTLRVLPIEAFHGNPLYLDLFSGAFEEYVDWAVRDSCPEMCDDPMLLGYVLCRAPGWDSHPAGRGWGDRLDLQSASGSKELHRMALRYYRVCVDTIRRYDEYHLILGDDFRPMPKAAYVVYDAMAEAGIEILSVHGRHDLDNPDHDARYWHGKTGRPVLLSDQAVHSSMQVLPPRNGDVWPDTQEERGRRYEALLQKAFSLPYIVGWNWDAWIENRERRAGIKTFFDEPYAQILPYVIRANHAAAAIHQRSHA